MKGVCRKFNKKDFDKYDTPARKVVKDKLGDYVQDNPNIYKQDMLIPSPNCRYNFLEIQVCAGWVEEEYPFDTVYIYERKAVYDSDTLFLTLSSNLKYGFLFEYNSIKKITPRRLKKYSREFVYDIPWSKVLKVYIEHLDKETLELY